MENTDSGKPLNKERTISLRDRFALRRLELLIILIIATLIFVWIYQRGSRAYEGTLGRPLRVGIVAWPGYAGGLVANNGLRANKDSYFWNEHKLLVEFVEEQSEVQLLEDFANGKFDIIWSTVDSLAQQAPTLQKRGIHPRAFMQVDWSRGGDAIIASAEIKQIEGLKGKRIAVSIAASQWLLEYSLKNSSLTDAERAAIRQALIKTQTRGSQEAGELFANNRVDAAVLWEPDVTKAIKSRPGAHILVDTSTASNLIADVMVAKQEFIEQHPDVIRAFIDGWIIYGTTEALKDPMLAARVLQNETDFANLGEKTTLELLGKTKWATLEDNKEMFGLSGSKGFFDELFNWASRLWKEYGLISDPISADQAKNIGILEEVYSAHESAPEPNCGAEVPLATIVLRIPFIKGKAELVDDARSILNNQEALFTLQTHTGARFCVQADPLEADATQTPLEITAAREKTVIEYLIQHFGRPTSQFVSASASPSERNTTTHIYIRLKLVPGNP